MKSLPELHIQLAARKTVLLALKLREKESALARDGLVFEPKNAEPRRSYIGYLPSDRLSIAPSARKP